MRNFFFKTAFLGSAFFLLTGFGKSNKSPSETVTTFKPLLTSGPDLSIPSNLQCDGGQVPLSVKKALEETLEFQKTCGYLSGFNKRIAINDYSDGSNPPTMYIFDDTGTQCLMKTEVAFGGGGAGIAPPEPCSGDGQKLTPPGIHLTATHNGSRYSGSNAIGLVGMSGQGSVGRGVIMHPKESAGKPSTWGCTGIDPGDFQKVREILGEGSIVNNYFGNKSAPGSCSDTNGLNAVGDNCRPDPGAPSPQALIHSSPASRNYDNMPMSNPKLRQNSGDSSGHR